MDGRMDALTSGGGDLASSQSLPTGTVTLLLADVEASTRLWDCAPDEMTTAIAVLDHTLLHAIAAHRGVRPVEQGEGDSFVLAFARPSDAAACALELQTSPLAPIRLRIGVHTGEVQLRDEGNYVGPTINRAARIRDMAYGGQTVLSGTTADLVVDRLPENSWLTELGSHHLRDLPRPERLVQLCHPDMHNEFPPLRTPSAVIANNLPTQLTTFVGRTKELGEICRLVPNNRLISLTGTGGIGKTRLAQEVSARLIDEFSDGIWYVDLAAIGSADVVAATVARALGMCDQPGSAGADKLVYAVGTRQMMIVLDNCEHVLDACAALAAAMLAACPQLAILATSRESLGVPGEVVWRVPSLPVADDAVALFADRARLGRPDFRITDHNLAVVTKICQRLDGMPLAIELAAARVRALSLTEILDGLRDRFRLLTGGARTAVQRQQTLRASMDWSYRLLTGPELVLFRRLAVFAGGFDIDAAQAIAGSGDLQRHHVLDQLSLLVGKSLVIAEQHKCRTRYRLLETVRQYAQEKLGDSGEAEAIRSRHRNHYSSLAAMFETMSPTDLDRHAGIAETEIDNLRAALAWSLDRAEVESALALTCFLQPLWRRRGRIQEGLAWFDAALASADRHGVEVAPELRVRTLVDRSLLTVLVDPGCKDVAAEALALAREIGEPALLLKALNAWCSVSPYSAEVDEESFTEAFNLAQSLGDVTALSEILPFQAFAEFFAGAPRAELVAAEKGLEIGESVGDDYVVRNCRWNIGMAHLHSGDLGEALSSTQAYLGTADTLECLASVTAQNGNYQEAARLFGSAQAVRDRTGHRRFKLYESSYHASVAAAEAGLGHGAFEDAWSQGATLSTAEAIAYANRGHGERKRATRGWDSITRTELEVVRFVGAGLTNKEIAAKLFISPRTVQAHLTHIYRKLAVTSRVQLAQEATHRL